jgi:superfamily II DNA or RNA helicase
MMLPEEEINIKYDYKGDVMYTTSVINVVYNEKRTNRIVEMIIEHARKGRKILVLGEYVKHLKDILKRLITKETELHNTIVEEKIHQTRKTLEAITPTHVLLPQTIKDTILDYYRQSLGDSCFTYGLYIGEMKNKDRKVSEDKDVILGTYKLASVGMDIPKLNTLIMVSPRKDIEQSVGRILRKDGQSTEVKPLIIDIIDNHGIFANQSRTRKQFYKEYGYTIEHIKMDPVTGKSLSKRTSQDASSISPKERKSAPMLDLTQYSSKSCTTNTKTKSKKMYEPESDDCLLGDD